MPRATSTKTDTKRVDLETCPPDGYVVIRRLDYGEKMSAQDMAAHIEASQAQQNGKPRDHQKAVETDVKMKLQMVSTVVQPYIFAKCIVEHNLQDADGNDLDFRKDEDVLRLDSTIAEEIEKAINDVNKGSLGNSSSVPDSNSNVGTP